MGFFDWFRPSGTRNVETTQAPKQSEGATTPTVCAALEVSESPTMTFDNRIITYRGTVKNIDYETILRDKEGHIYELFALSDYYVDEDPLYRGIIKQVYVPFSIADPWKLVGSNEETKRKYERLYKEMRLKDKMESVMYQYFKYANVYVYLFNDGRMITLPPDMIRISNIAVGCEPL